MNLPPVARAGQRLVQSGFYEVATYDTARGILRPATSQNLKIPIAMKGRFAITAPDTYLRPMRCTCSPCPPTSGKAVPSTPAWLHEVGYRLIVTREGILRLLTRNGHDWRSRYLWIVESALKNRHKQFVIDGEA